MCCPPYLGLFHNKKGSNRYERICYNIPLHQLFKLRLFLICYSYGDLYLCDYFSNNKPQPFPIWLQLLVKTRNRYTLIIGNKCNSSFSAFLCFFLSVYLWFSGNKEMGQYVSIWVPTMIVYGSCMNTLPKKWRTYFFLLKGVFCLVQFCC